MRYHTGTYKRRAKVDNDPSNPSEDTEQISFVEYLDEQRIPYWHTNNEMWTNSWSQKTRAKEMGVKSGIPDLFVVFEQGLVGIEMKRKEKGVVSPTQMYWANLLERAKIPVYVCRGKEKAVETIEHLLKNGYSKMQIEETYEEFIIRKNAEKLKKKRQKPVKF
jgi:VRR-NUC domain